MPHLSGGLMTRTSVYLLFVLALLLLRVKRFFFTAVVSRLLLLQLTSGIH